MIRQGRLFQLMKRKSFDPLVQTMPVMISSLGGVVSSVERGVRVRDYSISLRNQNSLIIGGLAILGVGATLQIGMKAYSEYEARKAAAPPPEQPEAGATEEVSSTQATSDKVDEKVQKKEKTEEKKQSTESSTSGLFGSFFATTFYDGGFGKSLIWL